MIYLDSITYKSPGKRPDYFPFTIPLTKKFKGLKLKSPVTFFVGENGSGKSTFLESIAAGINLVAAGGDNIATDPTLKPARDLAKKLKFSWNKKTHKGFFLRAEDFFRYTRRMHDLNKELEAEAKEFDNELSGYALQLAKGALLGERNRVVERYGEDLDHNSHGEGFLKFFKERMVPGGLYLLDEPETPLSPQYQLSLLSIMKDMAETGEAQFIIATHSPILMAMPGAKILSFDSHPLKEIKYDDIKHVKITRDFLNNPESFLRYL